jgi:hypothetical protein
MICEFENSLTFAIHLQIGYSSNQLIGYAQMAKLVDALPSGGSVRKDVQVRILFWARASGSIPEVFLFDIDSIRRMCSDLCRDSRHSKI